MTTRNEPRQHAHPLTPEQFARCVRDVLKDDTGAWRELDSRSHAIGEISGLVDRLRIPARRPLRRMRLTPEQIDAAPLHAVSALRALHGAREALRLAGAPASLRAVRHAIKSTEGALRNALGRKYRTDGEQR